VTIYGGVLADDATLGRHIIQKPFARAHTVPGDRCPESHDRLGSPSELHLHARSGARPARFMRSESDPIVIPDPRGGSPPGTTGGATQPKRGK
jgi:hypothetical protein